MIPQIGKLDAFSSEKAMTPHSSTLVWKIPRMEETGRLQAMGSLRVGHNWATSLSLSCIGEGGGNPLQCSCLENPRDGGAWWASVYGVEQSRTQLKGLSSSSRCFLGSIQEVMVSQYVNMIHQTLQSDLADLAGLDGCLLPPWLFNEFSPVHTEC